MEDGSADDLFARELAFLPFAANGLRVWLFAVWSALGLCLCVLIEAAALFGHAGLPVCQGEVSQLVRSMIRLTVMCDIPLSAAMSRKDAPARCASRMAASRLLPATPALRAA